MSSSPNDFTNQRIDVPLVTAILSDFHTFQPGKRDCAIKSLLELDAKSLIPVLREIINGSDTNLRVDAAEMLLRADRHVGLGTVLPLLKDPDMSVRWNVCGLLHDFGDDQAIESLTTVLLEDPHAGVRYMAAFALGELGDARVMPALQHAVAFDNGVDDLGYHVRDAAEEAIEAILARQ